MSTDFSLEQELLATCDVVVGIDEVGRGALAGPLYVGGALMSPDLPALPQGLRDSKALTARRRERIAAELIDLRWNVGVGTARASEIDSLGMTAALGLAATRMLRNLQVGQYRRIGILLDGVHDWVSPVLQVHVRQGGLGEPCVRSQRTEDSQQRQVSVQTITKGDAKCASIAAAAVWAKVKRDALMTELDQLYPQFGWKTNKGYGSLQHRQALNESGPCVLHRISWKIGKAL